jgi:hypothetical protein
MPYDFPFTQASHQLFGDVLAGQQQSQRNQLFPIELQGAILANQKAQMQFQREKDLMDRLKALQLSGNQIEDMNRIAGIALSVGDMATAESLLGKGAQVQKWQADTIRALTGAQKDETTLKYAPMLAEALTAARRGYAESAAARKKYYEAQTNLSKEREAVLRKTGGTKNTANIAANTKLATSLITRDYMLGTDQEAAYIYGRQIAERAADLKATNPALKDSEAVNIAYQQMKQSGLFAPYTPRTGLLGTKDRPAPLPPDSSKMVKGRYYVAQPGSPMAGKVGRWNGSKLELVDPEADLLKEAPSEDEVPSEDEEE